MLALVLGVLAAVPDSSHIRVHAKFLKGTQKTGLAFATRSLIENQCVLVTARHVLSSDSRLEKVTVTNGLTIVEDDATIYGWPGVDVAVIASSQFAPFCARQIPLSKLENCAAEPAARTPLTIVSPGGVGYRMALLSTITSPAELKTEAANSKREPPNFGSISDDVRFLAYAASVAPGDSGAAVVLDRTGEAIGVHVAEGSGKPFRAPIAFAILLDCQTRAALGKLQLITSTQSMTFKSSEWSTASEYLPRSIQLQLHRGNLVVDTGHFSFNFMEGRRMSWNLGLHLGFTLTGLEVNEFGFAVLLTPGFDVRRADDGATLQTSIEAPLFGGLGFYKWLTSKYSIQLDVGARIIPGLRTTSGVNPQLAFGFSSVLKLNGFNKGQLGLGFNLNLRRPDFVSGDFLPEYSLVIDLGPYLEVVGGQFREPLGDSVP